MVSTTIVRSVAGYTFDASLVETHESELEVTENPVETGVIIADHAFMKPLTYTLNGIVTDTPLRSGDNDPFGNGTGSRSTTAFEILQQLQKTAEPFMVVSGLRVYREMMLTKLTTSQDKDTANALLFTANFKEIIRVSTQAITYPPRAEGTTTRQASAVSNHGEQQGAQPDDQKKASLLAKLHSFFSGVSQ
jgi:hypothetical protein